MTYKVSNEKGKRRTATFVCAIICLAMVMSACATVLSSCGGTSGDTFYVEIQDDGSRLKVSIPVNDDVDSDSVYLFGIGSWESEIPEGATPLTKANVGGGEARAELEINGQLTETLCRGYLFAEKLPGGSYVPVTGVYYVTNARDAAEGYFGSEDVFDMPIKGAVGSATELLSLGVGSAVVTVELGDLIANGYSDTAIPYVWDGITYYADGNSVEELDKRLLTYRDAGIYVYLELVQTRSASELTGRAKDMVFSGAGEKKGYALNMTNQKGAAAVCGILDFLAERYCGIEQGSVGAFIVGRGVNDMANYYAGGPSGEDGIANYAKAVRAAYNILLSHNPKGRVYIALDNRWGVADSGSFTARDMLSSFNNLVSAQGDFYWQVSVEANASDRSDSSIWDDPMAVGRADFISPANGEVLGNQLSSDIYKCDGMERHILFNRFTVGGSDEEARAASYAYAYYKSLSLGSVDGLIYGAVTDADAPGEGLLTEDGTGDGKLIASVFVNIDREGGDLSFVSKLIGSDWDDLYKKHSKDAVEIIIGSCSNGDEHSNKDVRIITDFSGGDTFGFGGGDGVEYTELRYSEEWKRPVLYAHFDSDMATLVSPSVSAVLLEDTGYFGVTAKVGAKGGTAKVTVRLSGSDKDGTEIVLYSGTEVKTGEWTEFYCNVSDFIDSIDSDTVRVAIFTETAGDGAGEIYLARLIGEAPHDSGLPTWAIALIVVVAVGGGLTAFVLWFRKNYTFVRE